MTVPEYYAINLQIADIWHCRTPNVFWRLCSSGSSKAKTSGPEQPGACTVPPWGGHVVSYFVMVLRLSMDPLNWGKVTWSSTKSRKKLKFTLCNMYSYLLSLLEEEQNVLKLTAWLLPQKCFLTWGFWTWVGSVTWNANIILFCLVGTSVKNENCTIMPLLPSLVHIVKPLLLNGLMYCRKNPTHFKEFCHPGDDSYGEVEDEDDGEEEEEEVKKKPTKGRGRPKRANAGTNIFMVISPLYRLHMCARKPLESEK